MLEAEGRNLLKTKRITRSIQQAMPEMKLHDRGITEFAGKVFSVTYKLLDVDFASGSEKEQQDFFLDYTDILNALDTVATFKITLFNRNINYLNDNIYYLPENMGDGYDNLRIECNNMRRRNRARAKGIVQEKYLTVTVHKKKLELAENYFDRFEIEFSKKLMTRLSSGIERVDTNEKLRILHDFYRCGNEAYFNYDYKSNGKIRKDYRDYICPDKLHFHSNDFNINKRFGSVFFVRDWGVSLKAETLSNMMELRTNMMISIDIIPMTATEIKKFIEDAESNAEGNISFWSKKPGSSKRAGYAVIPIKLRKDREKVNAVADDVNNRNQKIFMASVSGVYLADTEDEIASYMDTLSETASEGGCQIAPLGFRQMDGLNTVLPYGPRFTLNVRDVTTENAAAMMPFNYVMTNHRTGIPYGTHSDNLQEIMIDRRLLVNGNEWVVAVSGGGKSLRVKITALFEVLMTNGNIIFVDPHGEFGALTKALGGQVIHIGGKQGDILNIMFVTAGYGFGDMSDIDSKIDTLSNIFKLIFGNEYTSYLNSIMIRVAYKLYTEFFMSAPGTNPPTVTDLYNEIKKQPEREAEKLALLMEVFISGPLRCFNGQTNVDLYSRVICFDLSNMGESLWTAGMTAVLDMIRNRLIINQSANVPTYIKVDETSRFLQDDELTRHFDRFYSEIRKFGGYITCIIQNISKIMRNGLATDMLSNSEIVVMLKQSEADAMELQELYKLSPIQVEQLTKADEGCGLLKCGNSIFSYNGQIEKGGYIYSLVDTKPDYTGSKSQNTCVNAAKEQKSIDKYAADIEFIDIDEPFTEILTQDMLK